MLKTTRSFCRKERDAINHIFWSCPNIKLFQEQLQTAVNERCVNVPSIKFNENIVGSIWTWCQFSVRWRSWFNYSVGNGFMFVFTNVKFERSHHNFISGCHTWEAATTALFGVLNQSARHLRTLSPTSSSSHYLKGECFCSYSKHAVTISVAIQNTLWPFL